MHGEIIAVGDEIISGKVLNTNSNFSARSLFHAGYEVRRITSVGDDPDTIAEVLGHALRRSRFVIVTGGLGPTPDDITNEAVARALGRRLVEDHGLRVLLDAVPHDEYPITESQKKKLTHLPEGAEALKPASRMAGYMIALDECLVFCLPGVPEELEDQLKTQVIPRLRSLLPSNLTILQKTYKIFGLNVGTRHAVPLKEVEVHEMIEALEFDRTRVFIGYYPNFPEVHVTVTTRDRNHRDAYECFENVKCSLREMLGPYVVAEDDETIEERVGTLLLDEGARLATAESCTGGLIASMITGVPGSSNWFDRGVVTYSNQSKVDLLGVKPETLEQFGAVSPETCTQMVHGLRTRSNARYVIAVTGIAGPGGATPEKPVGTVYIGYGTPHETVVNRYRFKGTRIRIQRVTAETALDLIRRILEARGDQQGY